MKCSLIRAHASLFYLCDTLLKRTLKTLAKILLMGFSLSLSVAGCSHAQTEKADIDTPKITLQASSGGNHCTLDFVSGKYDFEDDTYCNNDKAIGIEFEHAPSASNILLFDDYTCDRNDDGNYFWLYLRTVKEDVTLPPIPLEEIMTIPVGGIVRPGVRVMGHYRKQSEGVNGRTSCILIQKDAPPLD